MPIAVTAFYLSARQSAKRFTFFYVYLSGEKHVKCYYFHKNVNDVKMQGSTGLDDEL